MARNEQMTMGQQIATYLSLQAKAKALAAEVKAAEAGIRALMEEQGVNEISDNGFTARVVLGNQRKFDTNAFKAAHPDVYEAFRHDVPTKTFQAFAGV